MKKKEAWGGVLVFLFGVATVYLSLKMPIGTFRAAGSGLFPLLLGAILMILSGLFILKILLETGRQEEKAGVPTTAATSSRRVILFMGAIVLTILIFKPLGYPFASFLLLLLLLQILGVKPWYRTVLLSFSAALISYLMFVQWLNIPLPKGLIGL